MILVILFQAVTIKIGSGVTRRAIVVWVTNFVRLNAKAVGASVGQIYRPDVQKEQIWESHEKTEWGWKVSNLPAATG